MTCSAMNLNERGNACASHALLSVLVGTCLGCSSEDASTWQSIGIAPETLFKNTRAVDLCVAISKGEYSRLDHKALIEAGACDAGEHGATPLLWAYIEGRKRWFQELLTAGADPSIPVTEAIAVALGMQNGDTVLHAACRNMDPFFFDSLILDSTHVGTASKATSRDTPLFSVIKGSAGDKRHRLQRLMELGADPNSKCQEGSTAAMQAVTWGGQYDLAILLLDNGADPARQRDGHPCRLIHVLAGEERRLKVASREQQQDYKRLITLLEAGGEDLAAAKADIERWRSYLSLPAQLKRAKLESERKNFVDQAS